MRHIAEVVQDIETQLTWRGPNNRAQGVITLPRDDMQLVLNYVKSTTAYMRETDARKD